MSMQTRNQRLAQAAYQRVVGRGKLSDEYVSFARRFPSLIHSCGLAQAIAFAKAKGASKNQNSKKAEMQYLEDLTSVLGAGGHHQQIASVDDLEKQTREAPVSQYMRLSRDAVNAASWLKRYVEAVSGEKAG